VAGQVLAPVAGLSSMTAAGLARRFTERQWRAVETGIGDIQTVMLAALPPARASRSGGIRLRADAGYFAGALSRVAHLAGVEFAIGAKRIARCGDCSMASPLLGGPTRSTCPARGAQSAVAEPVKIIL
jgi:hypothetical protein